MNKRRKGFKLEDIACEYLKNKGYEIIQRNFHCGKYGEIDIIAKKDNQIVFIEVRSLNKIEPSKTITLKKLEKLENCINFYISKFQIENYKIEVIIIENESIIYHGEIEI
ncbi:MAG: YraN family protein [candidate division WOR-3 bacterium]